MWPGTRSCVSAKDKIFGNEEKSCILDQKPVSAGRTRAGSAVPGFEQYARPETTHSRHRNRRPRGSARCTLVSILIETSAQAAISIRRLVVKTPPSRISVQHRSEKRSQQHARIKSQNQLSHDHCSELQKVSCGDRGRRASPPFTAFTPTE